MTPFSELLAQGAGQAWFFIPSAILLGVLHGLEPGHSKTMMAAFIVAVRGTVVQAMLLGLAATVSHTLVVWTLALAGLYAADRFDVMASEGYFQIASGVIILGVAAWMVWRTWRDAHDHDHHHDAHDHDHDHRHEGLDHDHDHHHHDDHADAHMRAHARDIARRFAGRTATTPQIVLFGLTGGLIPCPAAITVLLLCLQLKQVALGATLVVCFSIGLALTLVSVGVIAALGMRHAAQRWSGFDGFMRRAPYLSGVLIACVGVYVTLLGWQSI